MESRNKTELTPHIIYCDFESYLSHVKDDETNTSKTKVIDEHKPSGFCAYTVSEDPQHPNKLVRYSGDDCMEVFFDHMMKEQMRIACIEEKNIDMLPLTRHQQEKFAKAEKCRNCSQDFTETNHKCRHHNHSTGNYIGAVCNACNLQLKGRRKQKRENKTKLFQLWIRKLLETMKIL